MNDIIENEIIGIVNIIKRADAPTIASHPFKILFIDTQEYLFDIIDSKEDKEFIKSQNTGTAHYINGNENDTYNLRFICYDDFLHTFVYDDGNGHTHKSMLKDNTKMADFLVYDTSESKTYFIIHEISTEASYKKLRQAKLQLSDTVNQLFKSEVMTDFINSFSYKLCILSAKDERKIVDTHGLADGFMNIYEILPEPLEFNYGQINTKKFRAFESSFVILNKI